MSTMPPEGAPPRGPAGPAPDLPPVPSARMARSTKVILTFGVLVVLGYSAAASSGWEPGQPARDEIPASVRSSPGGYRTFHFWHSGYHGGK